MAVNEGDLLERLNDFILMEGHSLLEAVEEFDLRPSEVKSAFFGQFETPRMGIKHSLKKEPATTGVVETSAKKVVRKTASSKVTEAIEKVLDKVPSEPSKYETSPVPVPVMVKKKEEPVRGYFENPNLYKGDLSEPEPPKVSPEVQAKILALANASKLSKSDETSKGIETKPKAKAKPASKPKAKTKPGPKPVKGSDTARLFVKEQLDKYPGDFVNCRFVGYPQKEGGYSLKHMGEVEKARKQGISVPQIARNLKILEKNVKVLAGEERVDKFPENLDNTAMLVNLYKYTRLEGVGTAAVSEVINRNSDSLLSYYSNTRALLDIDLAVEYSAIRYAWERDLGEDLTSDVVEEARGISAHMFKAVMKVEASQANYRIAQENIERLDTGLKISQLARQITYLLQYEGMNEEQVCDRLVITNRQFRDLLRLDQMSYPIY